MEAAVVLGVAAAALGVAVLVGGLRASAAQRRRHATPEFLEDLVATPDRDLDLDEFAERLARPFVERIVHPLTGQVTSAAGSITPRDHRVRVRTALAQAGLDTDVRPEEVIAAQGIGAFVGLVLGVGVIASGRVGPVTGVVLLLLLAGLGAIAPMLWLSRRADHRTDALRRDLPETLDLLAISVEAGLGLEGAMEVVVAGDDGPLARELERTLQEMELGASRRDALGHLRQRVQVPELATFVQALVQADVLGMPLTRVLKVQADEMRAKRRQWARERAAKLPVKILFPLVACIFPAILVVVIGPAVGQMAEAL